MFPQGLDYLHFNEVVHGDIKPANLMMEANTHTVKIVDFGSAVLNSSGGNGVAASLMGGGGGTALMCTPAFRSPESLKPGYRLSFEVRSECMIDKMTRLQMTVTVQTMASYSNSCFFLTSST